MIYRKKIKEELLKVTDKDSLVGGDTENTAIWKEYLNLQKGEGIFDQEIVFGEISWDWW